MHVKTYVSNLIRMPLLKDFINFTFAVKFPHLATFFKKFSFDFKSVICKKPLSCFCKISLKVFCCCCSCYCLSGTYSAKLGIS